MIYALGADPGAEGGLALVRLASVGLPELICLWRLTGATDRAWYQNASAAARSARGHLDASKVTDTPVWIEQPGHEGGGKANPRNRVATWDRLGLRRGMLAAACYEWGFEQLHHPQPGQWPGVYGKLGKRNLIPVGKDRATHGAHRVDEALRYVSGCRFELLGGPETGRVDRAEAVLIAGAAALTRRSVENSASIQRRAS